MAGDQPEKEKPNCDGEAFDHLSRDKTAQKLYQCVDRAVKNDTKSGEVKDSKSAQELLKAAAGSTNEHIRLVYGADGTTITGYTLSPTAKDDARQESPKPQPRQLTEEDKRQLQELQDDTDPTKKFKEGKPIRGLTRGLRPWEKAWQINDKREK